ncbi:MAG: ATP-grasp domain-containing protein, partial [Sedimentisphaerales bacterium]|nr:ATP-grasp domain-containing protein [Sedimentisphaerales bacterium]
MVLLIAGVSTRAIAESAAGHGATVITLDYFGDRDQKALVENHSLMRDFGLDFSDEALLQVSRGLAYDELVYIANLENHPKVVEAMSSGRVLRGNPPTVLRQVRDWRRLRAFGVANDVLIPITLLPGEQTEHIDPAAGWLVKPMRSGSGHGIRFWKGEQLADDQLLQRYVKGTPASAAFVADGRRCIVLGMSEQLIGKGELGARDFRWCGNILPLAQPHDRREELRQEVEAICTALTQEFGLVGVNGIDLVLDEQNRPFLVEVNPRYTASMELIGQVQGLDILALHLAGCAGRLPELVLSAPERNYCGKGIVFARQSVVMPETADWHRLGRRDIP